VACQTNGGMTVGGKRILKLGLVAGARRGSGGGDWWCALCTALVRVVTMRRRGAGTFIIGEVVQHLQRGTRARRVQHSTAHTAQHAAHWAEQSRAEPNRREGRISFFGGDGPADHNTSCNKTSPPEWLRGGLSPQGAGHFGPQFWNLWAAVRESFQHQHRHKHTQQALARGLIIDPLRLQRSVARRK
jgi:hypothetical protein